LAKLVILQADFDILEPSAHIRAHCHTNDWETYLFLPLLTSRTDQRPAGLRVGNSTLESYVEGRPLLFDAAYEHEEVAGSLIDAGVIGHNYSEELRLYYTNNGLIDKVDSIPDILSKWLGKEEKMMRELRKKYFQGWGGERVMLRLLIRSSILKSLLSTSSTNAAGPPASDGHTTEL